MQVFVHGYFDKLSKGFADGYGFLIPRPDAVKVKIEEPPFAGWFFD
jgi:hypothetical protein